VASALNIATHGVTHPFICQAILAYIVTMDPQIPKASSILRPVRVTAPPGTIVNCLFPAAIGVRYGTVIRVFDAILGALAQALPGRVPAAPAGATSPIVASVLDPFTGQRQVQVVEPMIGGGGGRPDMDGVDGADSTSGYLRNTPAESIEAEVPIILRRYHLIPGTGGPGRNRGGLALRLDFEFSHPHSIVTARGMERFKLAPWGLYGGRAGTSGSCVVNRGTPRARDIGKVDVLHLEPGDVVSIFAPSGGGYGDPREREPERVRADVRRGALTVAQAVEQYGVVIVDGRVDAAATAAARAAMPPPSGGLFDLGPGREALERRWPPALQDATVRLIASVPPTVRDWCKHRIYDRVQAIAATRTPTVEDVEEAWVAIRARLTRALHPD
jgi:N-methylhydantoinase B